MSYETLLEFPAVTICPGYQFRASVLRAKEPDDRYGCRPGFKYCSWVAPWNLATHTETIIKNCQFQRKACNPGTEQLGKWTRKLTSLGRCFTYNANSSVQSGGVSNALQISVDPMLWDQYGIAIFNGIRVYIHNASEIPLVEITGLNLNQGSTVHFSLQVKDYDRVSSAESLCTSDSTYDESRCIMRCIYKTTMILSNNTCGAPFMQEFKTKVCRTRKEIAFFNENFQKLIYNGSIWNKCVGGCPGTCKKRIYKPITTSLGFGESDSELVNITIYFANMWTEKIIETWNYNFEEFLVDMGGSLNLFLGASFYSLIQIIDLIIEYFRQLITRIYIKANRLELKQPHFEVDNAVKLRVLKISIQTESSTK
ncbi:unnamed protein product [Orchesella dallaii]|uniref:Uncharacterized protein n=1 Tax=Orchesella dallaii TaxID=48710 RepID=A0ABP1QWM0_9HEXA